MKTSKPESKEELELLRERSEQRKLLAIMIRQHNMLVRLLHAYSHHVNAVNRIVNDKNSGYDGHMIQLNKAMNDLNKDVYCLRRVARDMDPLIFTPISMNLDYVMKGVGAHRPIIQKGWLVK